MTYYFICFILSAFLTAIHIFKWKNQYGLHFALMYIFATIANFGYWQISCATQLNQVVLANKLAYVGGCFSTLSLMMCIFTICKVDLNRWIKLFLYGFTSFIYGSCLTAGYSGIFYKSVELKEIDGEYVFVKEYAFLHTVFYVMLVSYVIVSLIVLIIGFRKKKEISFKSVGIMFVVMLINFLSFFIGRKLFDIELISASYVITEIGTLIITSKIGLHNIDDMVMLSMLSKEEVGAASFDFDYCFLGCNQVARRYYPALDYLAVDKKIDKNNEALYSIVEWINEIKEKDRFELIYEQDEKWYKVSGNYLYENNKKRGYNFIFTDYTEEKERGEEMVRIATKAKSGVLAQMSHEIRTPINAILGMNEMILRTTKEIESRQYAQDVKRAARSLLEIVNEILDFSKIESGKMELVCTDYNLANLYRDVVNMFSLRAKEKNLKFIASIDENLPTGLYGDDVKVRQILANLLSNAVKYTKEGRVYFDVKGTIREDKVVLRFSVKDTGIGIKPEDMSKLFAEFERIEDVQNRGVEGTGLGMSITIRLLQMMESSLKVESEYGKGTEFFFELEQPIVDEEKVGECIKRQQKELEKEKKHESFLAPDASILVVDDNPMNRKVFCSLLRGTKIQIDAADSGQMCLELVVKKKYDIIFLDHMMPEMDGIETLRRLKKIENSKSKDTPVVALTANVVNGAKEFYLAEGFDKFLGKPFNPDELEKMILELLPREYVREKADEIKKINADEEGVKESIETGENEVPAKLSDAEENEGVDSDDEKSRQAQQKDEKRLSEVEGIDWNQALSHFHDEETMMDIVEDFYKSLTKEADKLEQFYVAIKEQAIEEKEGLNQYRIQVHSMKSAANLIGATILGEKAKALEDGARSEDKGFVLDNTEEFLDEWRTYKERLRPLFKEDDNKPEIDKESLKQQLNELKEAFEDMDLDRMDLIMNGLKEYSFAEDIAEEMDSLSAYVADLDDEGGIEVIERVLGKIIA